jgi:hypothetical protein
MVFDFIARPPPSTHLPGSIYFNIGYGGLWGGLNGDPSKRYVRAPIPGTCECDFADIIKDIINGSQIFLRSSCTGNLFMVFGDGAFRIR